MAESLDDAEFWLPPQFLADDELFPAESVAKKKKSFGSASDLGSPVESLVWSSETESESEEEFLAGLALQMSRSTLENDNRKARNLSGSPQSTLCGGFGSGEQGSSRGSPNAATSRVSSPPPPQTPAPGTLDLLNAAAGEVAKIRTVAEQEEEQKLSHSNHNKNLLDSHSHAGHLRNPSFDYQRQFQFGQLKQIQIMKQQAQLRYHQIQQQQQRFHDNNSGAVRTLGLPNSAWPTLQQAQNPRNGSNMTALFLGNQLAAGKRECAGTGVFLPRQQVGAKTETRRKQPQVCSTVLLPARVVQALNLNMDDIQPQVLRPRFHGRIASDADMTKIRLRNDNNVCSNLKRNVMPQQQEVNHEIRLPQDWTY